MRIQPLFQTFCLFSFCFIFTNAYAAPPSESPMDTICVTEIPTTSFIVKQDGSEVDIQVIHHNGIQFAPIRNALITPYDLPVLQNQASAIAKLGNEWHFKWKRSSCNADSPMFFQCIGEGQDFETNGIKVHPSSLTVTDVEQKSIWGAFQHKNITLAFNLDGNQEHTYEITMNYQNRDCIQSTDKTNSRFHQFVTKTKNN